MALQRGLIANCSLTVVLGLCLFMASEVNGTTCSLPSEVQGQWDITDSSGTTSSGSSSSVLQCTVDINSTGLHGVTFWEKTLFYHCYLQRENYYVFVSEPTDLFEQYDVNLYFCWYLQSLSSTSYRLYPLTEKVLYTVEERAKAFLNTTSPIINDVCEIPLDSAPSYKDMQMAISP